MRVTHRHQISLLIISEFKRIDYKGQFSYPIKCQCCPHIETSQLICYLNQLTSFYMTATLAFNGLNPQNIEFRI